MTVQIHIDGLDAGEAIRELSVLASHLNLSAVPALATGGTPATAIEAPKTEKPPARNRSTTKPAEPVKEEKFELTGTICSSCKEPQFNTTSGVTCPNGHGGVASEEDKQSEPIVEDELDLHEGDNGPVITVEELRAKAGEVAKSGKQAEVKALLTKFEAASISALPEDKRAEFMKVLEAL